MHDSADFYVDSYLDTKAQVSEEDGDLYIRGIAADWGIDDQDEAFEPGAFNAGIKSFLETNPVLCYHHNFDHALGQVLELKPTPEGLYMKARVDKPAPGSPSEDIFEKIRRGTIRGLSVAGKFRRHIGPDGLPRINEVGLREISVTPVPVNPRTMFAVAQKAFGSQEQLVLDHFEESLDTLDQALSQHGVGLS